MATEVEMTMKIHCEDHSPSNEVEAPDLNAPSRGGWLRMRPLDHEADSGLRSSEAAAAEAFHS